MNANSSQLNISAPNDTPVSIHLAIDAIGNNAGGGATILIDLLETIIHDSRIARVTVFCSSRERRSYDLPASDKVILIEQVLADRYYFIRIWWFQYWVGRVCQHIKADVLLCLNGMGTGKALIPHATYIQQSLPFSQEAMQKCNRSFKIRMLIIKLLMRLSCDNAELVIVQTPTMKRWVFEHFKIDEKRLKVCFPFISLPCHDTDVKIREFDATPPDRRLLYVGNHYAYKNLDIVLEGMKDLRQVYPHLKLFIIGPPNQSLSQDGIIQLGYLEKCQVYDAYRQSTLLVQPSIVETLSLPVVEALLLGTPVLIADRPYAHDVCQDTAEFFNPNEKDDFVAKTKILLQDERRRADMSKRGKTLMESRNEQQSYHDMLTMLVKLIDS